MKTISVRLCLDRALVAGGDASDITVKCGNQNATFELAKCERTNSTVMLPKFGIPQPGRIWSDKLHITSGDFSLSLSHPCPHRHPALFIITKDIKDVISILRESLLAQTSLITCLTKWSVQAFAVEPKIRFDENGLWILLRRQDQLRRNETSQTHQTFWHGLSEKLKPELASFESRRQLLEEWAIPSDWSKGIVVECDLQGIYEASIDHDLRQCFRKRLPFLLPLGLHARLDVCRNLVIVAWMQDSCSKDVDLSALLHETNTVPNQEQYRQAVEMIVDGIRLSPKTLAEAAFEFMVSHAVSPWTKLMLTDAACKEYKRVFNSSPVLHPRDLAEAQHMTDQLIEACNLSSSNPLADREKMKLLLLAFQPVLRLLGPVDAIAQFRVLGVQPSDVVDFAYDNKRFSGDVLGECEYLSSILQQCILPREERLQLEKELGAFMTNSLAFATEKQLATLLTMPASEPKYLVLEYVKTGAVVSIVAPKVESVLERVDWPTLRTDCTLRWMRAFLTVMDTYIQGFFPSNSTGWRKWFFRVNRTFRLLLEISTYVRRCVREDPQLQLAQILLTLPSLSSLKHLFTLEDVAWKLLQMSSSDDDEGVSSSSSPSVMLLRPELDMVDVKISFVHFFIGRANAAGPFADPDLSREWRRQCITGGGDEPDFSPVNALLKDIEKPREASMRLSNFMSGFLNDTQLDELNRKIQSLQPDLLFFTPPLATAAQAESEAVNGAIQIFSSPQSGSILFRRYYETSMLDVKTGSQLTEVLHLLDVSLKRCEENLKRTLRQPGIPANALYGVEPMPRDALDAEEAAIGPWCSSPKERADLKRLLRLVSLDRREMGKWLTGLKQLLCILAPDDCGGSSSDTPTFYTLVSTFESQNLGDAPYFGQSHEEERESLNRLVAALEERLTKNDVAWPRVLALASHGRLLPAFLKKLASINGLDELLKKIEMLQIRHLHDAGFSSSLVTLSELMVPLKQLADFHHKAKGKLSDDVLGAIGRLIIEPSITKFTSARTPLRALIIALNSISDHTRDTLESNTKALSHAHLSIVKSPSTGCLTICLQTSPSLAFQIYGKAGTDTLLGENQINELVSECLVAIAASATRTTSAPSSSRSIRTNTLLSNGTPSPSLDNQLAVLQNNLTILSRVVPDLERAARLLPGPLPLDFKFQAIKPMDESKYQDVRVKLTTSMRSLRCAWVAHPYLEQVDDSRLLRFLSGEGESWVGTLIAKVAEVIDCEPIAPMVNRFGGALIDKQKQRWLPFWNKGVLARCKEVPSQGQQSLPVLIAITAADYHSFMSFYASNSSSASVELTAMSALLFEPGGHSESVTKLLNRLNMVTRVLNQAVGTTVRSEELERTIRRILGVLGGLVIGGVLDLPESNRARLVAAAVAYAQACSRLEDIASLRVPSLIFVSKTENQQRKLVADGFLDWFETNNTSSASASLTLKTNLRLCIVPDDLRAKGPLQSGSRGSALSSSWQVLLSRDASNLCLSRECREAYSKGAKELVLDLCTLDPQDVMENLHINFFLHSLLFAGLAFAGTPFVQSLPTGHAVVLEMIESRADGILDALGLSRDKIEVIEPPSLCTNAILPNSLAAVFRSSKTECFARLDRLARVLDEGRMVSDDQVVEALRVLTNNHTSDVMRTAIPFYYSRRSLEMIKEMLHRVLHEPFPQPVLLAGDTGVGKSYISLKFCELLIRAGFPFNVEKDQVLYTFHASFSGAMIAAIGKEMAEQSANNVFTFPIMDEVTASPAQSELDRLLFQRAWGDGPSNLARNPHVLLDSQLCMMATCNPVSDAMDFVFPLTPCAKRWMIEVPAPDLRELQLFVEQQLTQDNRGPKLRSESLIQRAVTSFMVCKAALDSQEQSMGPITPRSAVLFAGLIRDILQLMQVLTTTRDPPTDEDDEEEDVSSITIDGRPHDSVAVVIALYVYFGVRTVPRQRFFNCFDDFPSPFNERDVKEIVFSFTNKMMDMYPQSEDLQNTLALRENVLCGTIALFSRKPLLILGRDGETSKTTSLGVLSSSMQGKFSTRQLLRKLPAVLNFRLQMSQETTAMDIHALTEAIKALERAKDVQATPAVIIEELSMMNRIGPAAPIRAFHALLDHHQRSHRNASKFGSGTNSFAFIATSNFDKNKFGELPIGKPLANRLLILCHDELSREEKFRLCWQPAANDKESLASIVRQVIESSSVPIRSGIFFAQTARFLSSQWQLPVQDAVTISKALHFGPQLRLAGQSLVRPSPSLDVNHWVMKCAMARGAPRRAVLVAYDTLGELEEMWQRLRSQYEGNDVQVISVRDSGSRAEASQIECLWRLRIGCERGSLMAVLNPEPVLNQIHALLNDLNRDASSIQIRKCFDVCQIAESTRIILFVRRSKIALLHDAVLSRLAYINPVVWPLKQVVQGKDVLSCLQGLVTAAHHHQKRDESELIEQLDTCQLSISQLPAAIANQPNRGVIAFMRFALDQTTFLPSMTVLDFGPNTTPGEIAEKMAAVARGTNKIVVVSLLGCDDEQLVQNLTAMQWVMMTNGSNGGGGNGIKPCILAVPASARGLFRRIPTAFTSWYLVDCLEAKEQYQSWPYKISEIAFASPIVFRGFIQTTAEIQVNNNYCDGEMERTRKELIEWTVSLVERGLSHLMADLPVRDRARYLLRQAERISRSVSLRILVIEHIRHSVRAALYAIMSRVNLPCSAAASAIISACIQHRPFLWMQQLDLEMSDFAEMAANGGGGGIWRNKPLLMNKGEEEEQFPFLSEFISVYKRISETAIDPVPDLESNLDFDSIRMMVRTFFQLRHHHGWIAKDALDFLLQRLLVPALIETRYGWRDVLRLLLENEPWFVLVVAHHVQSTVDPQGENLLDRVCETLRSVWKHDVDPPEMLQKNPSIIHQVLVVSSRLRNRDEVLFLNIWRDLFMVVGGDGVKGSYVLVRRLFGFEDQAITSSRSLERLKEDEKGYVRTLRNLKDFVVAVKDPMDKRLERLMEILKLLLIVDQSPALERLVKATLRKYLELNDPRRALDLLKVLLGEGSATDTARLLLLRSAFVRAVGSLKMDQNLDECLKMVAIWQEEPWTRLDWFIAIVFFPYISSVLCDSSNNEISSVLQEELKPFLTSFLPNVSPPVRHHLVRECVRIVEDESRMAQLKPLVPLLGQWFDKYCIPFEGLRAAGWLVLGEQYSRTEEETDLIKRAFSSSSVDPVVHSRLLSNEMDYCRLVAISWSAGLQRLGDASPLFRLCIQARTDPSLRGTLVPAMEPSAIEVGRRERLFTSLNMCGHCGTPYTIGDCGQPNGLGKCIGCQRAIGGTNHNFVPNQRKLFEEDLPIEGVPFNWFISDLAYKERELTVIEYRVLCLLIVLALYVLGDGAAERLSQLRKHWDACKRVCGINSDSELQSLLSFILSRSASDWSKMGMLNTRFEKPSNHSIKPEDVRKASERVFQQGFADAIRALAPQSFNNNWSSNHHQEQRATLQAIVQHISRKLDLNHALVHVRDSAIAQQPVDTQWNEFALPFFSFRRAPLDPITELIGQIRSHMLADIAIETNRDGTVSADYSHFEILWYLLFISPEGVVNEFLSPSQAKHLGLFQSARLHQWLVPFARGLRAMNDYAMIQGTEVSAMTSAATFSVQAMKESQQSAFNDAWEALRLENDLVCEQARFFDLNHIPAEDMLVSLSSDKQVSPARAVLLTLADSQRGELSKIFGDVSRLDSVSAFNVDQLEDALVNWPHLMQLFKAWLANQLLPDDPMDLNDLVERAEVTMRHFLKAGFNPKLIGLSGWSTPSILPQRTRAMLSVADLIPQEALSLSLSEQVRSLTREQANDLKEKVQAHAFKIVRNAYAASALPLRVVIGNNKVQTSIQPKYLDDLQRICAEVLKLNIEDDLPAEYRVDLTEEDRKQLREALSGRSLEQIRFILRMLLDLISKQIDLAAEHYTTIADAFTASELPYTTEEGDLFLQTFGIVSATKMYPVAKLLRRHAL